MPSVAVSGVQLYCEAPHGSGPPLVLLGSLGIDVSKMGMLTGPLAAWFQVIAAGNRGTGRSAKPAGPVTVEQMAADVAGSMDHFSLARAHLADISVGGGSRCRWRIHAAAATPGDNLPARLTRQHRRYGLDLDRPACPERAQQSGRSAHGGCEH